MSVVETQAGASSHARSEWHTISWYDAHKNVRQLQARIVKATKEGRWGKVKALQRLLTHSFSGKALAVKRVTDNQGKNTPGVDKVIWDTPEKKAAAIHSLQQQSYRTQPLRRVYIPKSNGAQRPLSIPVMKCRAMQALYLLALAPIAETTGDRSSYGFRSQRSPADAIGRCFNVLAPKRSAQWILEADIKGCFDHISHEWLKMHIPIERSMLSKWLRAGYTEGHTLFATEEGTPQGGTISPVLANLTLDGLERRVGEIFPKTTTKGHAAKINLVRFADDFIITGASKELLEVIKPVVEQFLKERGLSLSEEKTHITNIEEGFDFLGQNIRKYKGKMIIKPSKKNVKAFLDHVRGIIKTNKQVTAGHLIEQLTPVIRGWANYHRHVASKATYHSVDHAIFQSLWRWAKRRHPHKGKRWIKTKYFHQVGSRNWVFSGKIMGKERTVQTIHLPLAAQVAIKRHVPIRGQANPYDPEWEIYFEKRLGIQMNETFKGKRMLIYLWREQNGICPICHQKITKLTGWNNHHIIWRSKGGKETVENRVLLHPNCHRQVHSQRLEVTKPRPQRGGRKA